MANADMYAGFEAFLTGELGQSTESKYVPVPYVDASTKSFWQEPLAKHEILEDVNTVCIPWRNNHLLHIPGAHKYLETEYRKKKEFDINIGTLYALGPQTMDQAWHYYKYIVKQQRPTDRDLQFLITKPGPPNPRGVGGERSSNWQRNLTSRHMSMTMTTTIHTMNPPHRVRVTARAKATMHQLAGKKRYGPRASTRTYGLRSLLRAGENCWRDLSLRIPARSSSLLLKLSRARRRARRRSQPGWCLWQ
ncbi:hypothetical protein T492DRAFT_839272 [Pavlovales sp. CCMP2436]|nr:hypothetical protein T492DRAFT_839272 [Pavlovales sp. CCMP2436]